MKRIFSFLFLLAGLLFAGEVQADDPDYLCFTAEEATDVAFNVNYTLTTTPSLQYSTDETPWTDYTFGNQISLSKGDKVYFKATSTNDTFSESSISYIKFSSTGKVAASGNIMSLLDAKCARTNVPQYAFTLLFYGCTGLTTAPELPATTLAGHCYEQMFASCTSLTTAPALPATTLADYCYDGMFRACRSLTTAPELSATTLADYCCSYMFYGCTSLTTAPKLSATTLAYYCCSSMFCGCTSLTTAPELSATTLAYYCYDNMFNGCTSLTSVPALPATTLAAACYSNMFYGCTSLTSAPALPATTLAGACYYYMFGGCTSLTSAPALPATTLAGACYYYMFGGCTSLTSAPALPATTLEALCYYGMFNGCTSLESVTVSFTDWNSDNSSTEQWLEGAKSTGKFYCPADLTIPDTRSTSNVPNDWTIVIALDESSTTTAVMDGTSKNVQIKRTFYKDGGNNTICLPFALDATALAASPLTGYNKLQEFSSATIQNKGQDNETLELTMTDATEIEAGKPYIIAWANDGSDNLVNPVFYGVTVTADEGSASGDPNGVQFCGTLVPYEVTANDKSIMFVGSSAQLNWPNVASIWTVKSNTLIINAA